MEDRLFEKIIEAIGKVSEMLNKKTIISDLPEPIKELALKRQFELKGKSNASKLLINAFEFSKTPEGAFFWTQIALRDYSPFYELFPREKPNNKPTAPSEFKNGEKVEVKSSDSETWAKGTFIGMSDYKYVVQLKKKFIFKCDECRKIQQEEKEPVKEDKNAFVGDIPTEDLRTVSMKCFGDPFVFQPLESGAPDDKKELAKRAFFVSGNYEVQTGKSKNNSGTYIAIYKK